jgi:hypothetical protein
MNSIAGNVFYKSNNLAHSITLQQIFYKKGHEKQESPLEQKRAFKKKAAYVNYAMINTEPL